MQNDKLAETVAEQGLKYGDMLRESGHLFFSKSETVQICIKPHVPQA